MPAAKAAELPTMARRTPMEGPLVLRSCAFWDGLRWSGPNLIGLIWMLRRRIHAKPRAEALRFLICLFKWWLTAVICVPRPWD
jgi:hypothetical protein